MTAAQVLLVALLVAAAGAAIAYRRAAAPATRRHRRAALERVWDRRGLPAAYQYARLRGWWPEAVALRRELVARDPLGGSLLDADYRGIRRAAREFIEDEDAGELVGVLLPRDGG